MKIRARHAAWVLGLAATAVFSQTPDRLGSRVLPDNVSKLRLAAPAHSRGANPVIDRSLFGAEGQQKVIIRLRGSAVGDAATGDAQIRNKSEVDSEQTAFIDRHRAVGIDLRIIARTQLVLNAVFVEVDAAALPQIATDEAVLYIKPVADYEIELTETVPYVGAAAVQARGVDGKGIRVAILDSGVDYTHAAFGGPGTLAAYEAAFGTAIDDPRNTTLDGLFPTPKVVGGYDFVGPTWPLTPELAPDPDPIDSPDTGAGGHGTHVADIVGGMHGVAPGVSLYAVKVCSAVTTSCSGIALIQGLEFAVDPNGDGDPSDAVDIINMSLGANYGSAFNDDLSLAVDNATKLGVLTVAAAGNGGDKPYVQGTPAAARTALSVAQTQVPSASFQLIDVVGAPSAPGVFQSWSAPLTEAVSGEVQYGDGAGGNLDGCAEFAPDSLAGKIVLVDRGSCFFTTKIYNVGNAGGVAGIIGLITADAPFNGAYADPGGPVTVPGYMISLAASNAIKSVLPAMGTIDPTHGLPLVMSMVGTSSRGPDIDANRIKPEIGAPGASVSASAGFGTGVAAFGGTSGATPMVTGGAALLLDACGRGERRWRYPSWLGKSWFGGDRHRGESCRSPLELKALLMSSAETQIANDVLTGAPAPITRIGSGELRVDRAVGSAAAAWDDRTGGGVSFGQIDVADATIARTRKVRVRNFSDDPVVFKVLASFRFADDAANGAVSITTRPYVYVDGHDDATFEVQLAIDATKLPGNFMNSGSEGANPAALTLNEYDGYLTLRPVARWWGKSDDDDGYHHRKRRLEPVELQLPWHVLPRQAARIEPTSRRLRGGGVPEVVGLVNTGAGTAQNDAYALIALSEDLPEGARGDQAPTPDIAAVGVNTFPVPAGFCSGEASFIWAFAIHTHERQRHLIQPVSHQIWLDTNRDGDPDFVVLNRDVSFSDVSDGRQLAWSADLATGEATAFFFAEHATNTGNTVLYICGEQVGLTGTDMLSTNVDVTVIAQDWYYGGPGDEIDGLTVTPLGERFVGVPTDIPGFGADILQVYDFDEFPGNSRELGVLLLTNGDRGPGARGGATEDTEAVILKVSRYHWKH